MQAFSVAISAGGQSRRMGTDKAFVQVNGKAIIERVLSQVLGLGQVETFIVTNHPTRYKAFDMRLVEDVIPHKGALGGIYTAVDASLTDHVLVVACDMPFLQRRLMTMMIDQLAGDPMDVIVPRVAGYPQGLHAIYGKGCLPVIRERLDQNQLKVIDFYDEVGVRYLDETDYHTADPDQIAFFNVNTPEQLVQAQQIALKGDQGGSDYPP